MAPLFARVAPIVLVLLSAAACSSPTQPSPVLLLTFAEEPVAAQRVGPAGRLVATFPVSIGDFSGPGGTVTSVDTILRNVTRGVELGRNRRPNRNFVYGDVQIPPGGFRTFEAGIVVDGPPPTDRVEVTVIVTLEDGRSATRTADVVQTSN